MAKKAIVVTGAVLNEMLADYILKHEGKKLEGKDLELHFLMADKEIETARTGKIGPKISLLAVTWEG